MKIVLEPKYLDKCKQIFQKVLSGFTVEVFIFGSRARGDSRIVSDIDIAISSKESLENIIPILKTEFEESTIPYEFDLIDMSTANEVFAANVKKDGILLWKS